ncbi:MAG TPA: fumarylacetoacetate hydrolase family protein [Kofleriaceae bacterium]|nr:fumarylacetoacetate hydrolase family protein [Kofleriaceae bacterium]
MLISKRPAGGGDPQDYELSPQKIVCVGVNYHAHAAEMQKTVPPEPLFFLKPPSAIIASQTAICRPRGAVRVDHEGELGVVIGRGGRYISADRALEHVLGYVCVNDVTVRELQKRDGQWTRAKGFDTFCPLGPVLVTGLDAADITIETRVNGEVRQNARTSQMMYAVPELIARLSRIMTLVAGDVISTGTPSGVGPIVAGDRVEVEIEGIGILENPVIDETEGTPLQ